MSWAYQIYIDELKEHIQILENTLQKIESICDSLDRDCQEGDKVLCNTNSIRFEIAKVYPKYIREV